MKGKDEKPKGDEQDIEPTPPPSKDEPSDDMPEGEEEPEEEDEMDEAYKSLMAELTELRTPAPVESPPSSQPEPEVDMAAGDDEIVVDADTLLKAIQGNIDENIGVVAKRLEAGEERFTKSLQLMEQQSELLKKQGDMLKAQGTQMAAQTGRIEELEGRSQGRRGFQNIWEAGMGEDGMAKSMSADEYQRKGVDYIAKALKAGKEGQLDPVQVSMAEMVVNRGLRVNEILTPQERSIIESN